MTLSPEKIETFKTHLRYAMGTDHYHQTTMDVETATWLLQLIEKEEPKNELIEMESYLCPEGYETATGHYESQTPHVCDGCGFHLTKHIFKGGE